MRRQKSLLIRDVIAAAREEEEEQEQKQKKKEVATYQASLLDDDDDDDGRFEVEEEAAFIRPSTAQTWRGSSQRVKVAIRCRPVFPSLDFDENERRIDPIVSVEVPEPHRIDENKHRGKVIVRSGWNGPKSFSFDHVFGPETNQKQVYDAIGRPIVDEVIHGSNGAILAYGQTGTGKTYTMGILGRVNSGALSHGIIPNALRQLFIELPKKVGCFKRDCSCSWGLALSFVQIYLETVQDLFAPFFGKSTEDPLDVRQDPVKGFFVDGLSMVSVNSIQEALSVINMGLESREMATTSMNDASSRSHTILSVNLNAVDCNGKTIESILKLVDLAGSERIKVDTDDIQQRKEAQSINVSLSTLGKVVAALAQRGERPGTGPSKSSTENSSNHIPFRESKLTKLLQDTFGVIGGSNTALLATVSPSPKSFRETISTLQFAARCMKVQSEDRPRRASIGDKETIKKYMNLCGKLQSEIQRMKQGQTNQNLENLMHEKIEPRIETLREVLGSDISQEFDGLLRSKTRFELAESEIDRISRILGFSAERLRIEKMKNVQKQAKIDENASALRFLLKENTALREQGQTGKRDSLHNHDQLSAFLQSSSEK